LDCLRFPFRQIAAHWFYCIDVWFRFYELSHVALMLGGCFHFDFHFQKAADPTVKISM